MLVCNIKFKYMKLTKVQENITRVYTDGAGIIEDPTIP